MVYQGISEETHLAWLEELARQELSEPQMLIPGILVESDMSESARDQAERLLFPLYRLGLFPFQGERLWIEVSCTSWEQAELLSSRLARQCVSAAGLCSRFQGGAVIDLRWCKGAPPEEKLCELERFLAATDGNICPLILTSPGMAVAVRKQLARLDLQQIMLHKENEKELKAALERACLTSITKDKILKSVEKASPERIQIVIRMLRRAATGQGIESEAQLLAYLEPERQTTRKIGFGRDVEYDVC